MPIALGLGLAIDLRQGSGSAPEPPCEEPPVLVSYPIAPAYTGNFDTDEVYFTIVATLCGEQITLADGVLFNLYRAFPSDPTNFSLYTNSFDGEFYLGFAGSWIDDQRFKCEIIAPTGTIWTPEWTVSWTCSTAPNANDYFPNPKTVTNGSTFQINFSAWSCGGTTSTIERRLTTDPLGVWAVIAGPVFDPDPLNGNIYVNQTATPALNGAQYRAQFSNPYGSATTSVVTLIVT